MRRLLAALALATTAVGVYLIPAPAANAKANLTTVSNIGPAVVATKAQPLPRYTPVVGAVKTVKKKRRPIVIKDVVVEKAIEAKRLEELRRVEAEWAEPKTVSAMPVSIRKQTRVYEPVVSNPAPVVDSVDTGPSSRYNWATPGQCTWGALEKWRAATGWYLGGFYGNAHTWATRAAAAGHTVRNTPRARSVLVLQPGVHGSSSVGHVAWVTRVSGNRVTVVEMNALAGPYKWNTRTMTHQGGMKYIYSP